MAVHYSHKEWFGVLVAKLWLGVLGYRKLQIAMVLCGLEAGLFAWSLDTPSGEILRQGFDNPTSASFWSICGTMIAFMLAFASSSAVKKNTKAAACIGVFHRSAFKMMRAVHVVSSDFEKSQQSNEPEVTTKRAVLCVYGALCVELHYMDPQFFTENFIKDESKVQFAKWVDLMKADQSLFI